MTDLTALFNAEATDKGQRFGYAVEYDVTENIFNNRNKISPENMLAVALAN